MNNSSKYRKPPLRRTRDSFIDDRNSVQNPRIDLGDSRHTQIRRDNDKTRTLGITLYDIDFAIKSFIDNTIQLKVEDSNDLIQVPTIYANSEKWASIQKDGFLKDKKGKTMVPLLSFRRSNVAIKSEMRRNKVATTNQIAYIMKQKYNTTNPYDKFSLLNDKRKSNEYFLTPIPDYVDITYDFIGWCEYQNQLNYIIEQFIYFGGKSFGDRNSFKFSTNIDGATIEDSNTTGQDRLVRTSFQLLVHGYLIPKDVAREVTTKRIVTENKIVFTSEAFRSINDIQTEADKINSYHNPKETNKNEYDKVDPTKPDKLPVGKDEDNYTPINNDGKDVLEYYESLTKDRIDAVVKKSAGVYTNEIDKQ
jgi:hypothetical protein